MNYWLLKRYSRNGVPLLRRLQTMGLKKNQELKKQELNNEEFNKKIKAKIEELGEDEKSRVYDELIGQQSYFKILRQNLERARLLMELIR
jgi:hypothetical protein